MPKLMGTSEIHARPRVSLIQDHERPGLSTNRERIHVVGATRRQHNRHPRGLDGLHNRCEGPILWEIEGLSRCHRSVFNPAESPSLGQRRQPNRRKFKVRIEEVHQLRQQSHVSESGIASRRCGPGTVPKMYFLSPRLEKQALEKQARVNLEDVCQRGNHVRAGLTITPLEARDH